MLSLAIEVYSGCTGCNEDGGEEVSGERARGKGIKSKYRQCTMNRIILFAENI